ncbi:unnamed protein product [Closterium sp. NIES-54]
MGTWELVERPPKVNIMKKRWVLMTKYHVDDMVIREKARLVVKGFTQVYGADYDETYVPVSSYAKLRIFLGIVTVLDLNLMQLDMKNAFLRSNQVDEALYFKVDTDNMACWVLVYVNDLLAASSSTAMLKELPEATFELREISPVEKYFGLEIVRDMPARKLWLHQHGYANKLRRHFIDEEQTERTPKTPLKLVGYVDADDAGDKQNQTSTGGYVFVYRGAAISCSSQHIKWVTLSSTESENVAATEASKEGRRLRFLLAKFRQLDAGTPTVLRVDNKSAITVTEGVRLTGNLKHMERSQAWLRHMVKHGKLTLKYIPTTKQPADFLTKALHFPTFNRCSVAIGQVRMVNVGDGDNDMQHDGAELEGAELEGTKLEGAAQEDAIMGVWTASWGAGRRPGRLDGVVGARTASWAPGLRPGHQDADLDASTVTLGTPVWCSRRPSYLGDVCDGRRGGVCKANLGNGILRSTWLVGAVAGVFSAGRLRYARDEVWSTNQLLVTSQQQGVDYFQTFSPTPKMTTLWVLLHVAAQRDYILHSLDISTTFLQSTLHKEILLHRPPGFTGTVFAGTRWSLCRPVYGPRQAPRKWLDTLRTTLAALGFAPSTADPSLFLRTDT